MIFFQPLFFRGYVSVRGYTFLRGMRFVFHGDLFAMEKMNTKTKKKTVTHNSGKLLDSQGFTVDVLINDEYVMA